MFTLEIGSNLSFVLLAAIFTFGIIRGILR